jgi:hypothetical protein
MKQKIKINLKGEDLRKKLKILDGKDGKDGLNGLDAVVDYDKVVSETTNQIKPLIPLSSDLITEVEKDLTNKLPGYSIVTNNKFAWLWNAMEENPFGTDMFFWIDGGLSRFFKNYDIQNSQPHIRLIRDIRKTRKIFAVIGGGKEHYINDALQGKKLPTEEVIGANMGVVMTGFFGGHISTMKHASEYVMKNYVIEMIQKNRIDHDQSSIFLHFQENPEKYLLVPPHPQLDCFNFFLFASGQHMPIGV